MRSSSARRRHPNSRIPALPAARAGALRGTRTIRSAARAVLPAGLPSPWQRRRAAGRGTDMGGSVRIPAALCGLVGQSPALAVSRWILPTVFDDMSHFGLLATSVEDAALFLKAVEGQDPADILSRPALTDPAPAAGLTGKRFAYSPDLGYACYAVAPEVGRPCGTRLARLRAAGAEVTEVTLPWTRRVNDLWLTLWSVAPRRRLGRPGGRGSATEWTLSFCR
ncbi:MAG: amidase family protein [Defluviimonas denitrificans]